MPYIIKCQGLEGTQLHTTSDPTGQYLVFFDPDFKSCGACVWSTDKSAAIRYPSMDDALTAWKRQSSTHPLRADGHPNRPLTAYTVSLEPVEE